MYSSRDENHTSAASKKRWVKHAVIIAAFLCAIGAGWLVYSASRQDPEPAKPAYELTFDQSITDSEQSNILFHTNTQSIELTGPMSVSAETSLTDTNRSHLLEIYVPVAHMYAVRQDLAVDQLADVTLRFLEDTPQTIVDDIVLALGAEGVSTSFISTASLADLPDGHVAFVPASQLTQSVKLLSLNGDYYLDQFRSGAVFRHAVFSGDDSGAFSLISLSISLKKDDVLKMNTTGVTALTRIMQRKLAEVQDPLYFSAEIGEFLADADITHVSNEVSFLDGCTYSNTSFCSPPEFIETLKASGVDVVEITGNHNNDRGASANTATIELYESLGWQVVGGGLDAERAKTPFIADEKGSKIGVLAYNYPDSPNGGAIAGPTKAGANGFDFADIKTDIAALKNQVDYIMVHVQYWECYAYPNGYIEYPICDVPIGEQEPDFKKLVDLGADMVVGTSAHQPQTFEYYNGKPIYYGLGNLYFDQTSWPGTERGIVLTHYFVDGELVQTKLTPTVFDRDLQTRVMTAEESAFLLQRLSDAR